MHCAAFWFSLIYIFMIPWENAITVPELGTLTRVIGVVMAVLWLCSAPKAGLRKPHLFHITILLFVTWSIASLFWSAEVDATVQSIKTYVQLSIMAWVFWNLYIAPTALRAALQAYILGVYVAVGATLTNYLADKAVADIGSRYAGAGLDANELALIVSLGIPVAWHLATSALSGKRNHTVRLFNLACIPLALFTVLLTASRMGIFTAVTGSLFILGTLTRLRRFSRILIFAALIGATFILQTQVPQSSIDRLSTTSSSIDQKDLGGRYPIWGEAITLFSEHPIVGVGSGAFAEASTHTQDVAHNTFLSVLVENGLVGFGLFIMMLMVAVYQVLRKPVWGYGLWISLVLIWAIGASALTLERTKLTWLFLSLLIIGGNLGNEHESSSSVVAN